MPPSLQAKVVDHQRSIARAVAPGSSRTGTRVMDAGRAAARRRRAIRLGDHERAVFRQRLIARRRRAFVLFHNETGEPNEEFCGRFPHRGDGLQLKKG